jgi:hypothetical protein
MKAAVSTMNHPTKADASPIQFVRLSGKDILSAAPIDAASPEEGAALIRAFLQIEDKGVRAAIVDLVMRLSQASP